MRTRLLSIIVLASGSCLAADGFYLGANVGQLEFKENLPSVASLPVVGPPILYPVCGGTASFLFYSGAGGVGEISDDADAGLLTLGWRRGRFALELTEGPTIDFTESASRVPDETTQATCATAPPITVSMTVSGSRSVEISSNTLAALYDFDLAQRLRLQLRLQAAAWDSTVDTTFAQTVYETSDGVTFVPNVLVSESSHTETDGIDIGYGIGLAYAVSDRIDLRLNYQQQSYGDAESSGATLTATFTF